MLEKIKEYIKSELPSIVFTAGNQFYWAPKTNQVYFDKQASGNIAIWSLLHEASHAKLHHASYKSDYELVSLEVEAWEEAKNIAKKFKIKIDQNHIEDCLDTYRDWLAKRSACPVCGIRTLQQTNLINYRCYNCHSQWKVTPSRFCRPYRTLFQQTTS